ncbi:hypothetical protein AMAG_10648 [Allomyces macrogynus ATCC 38327]|uniref:Uncharacterized protein n=1 Tax=Allomyces macrogynus (strain ATCC 38327) TaxID=578462 RepID=A0A0L0SRI8_ALLM3|nr:hypothetical protein AMAG_10648 [Allomyces macrogynus ATCC 38327]|eukprot:KNE64980.1 hypothetical protein AMAG_10648 [Allomyces macrogynus ATCC 38327]
MVAFGSPICTVLSKLSRLRTIRCIHGACIRSVSALATLPVPRRTLRVSTPPWLTTASGHIVRYHASSTLRELHLDSRCPQESMLLAQRTSDRIIDLDPNVTWTFPSTLTSLDLSHNALTARVLGALASHWLPKLAHVTLSHNKLHTLPSSLPSKLRTLNVADKASLGEDVFPGTWTRALLMTLRVLDVTWCTLGDVAGWALVDACRRAGMAKSGRAKLHVVVDENEYSAAVKVALSELLH